MPSFSTFRFRRLLAGISLAAATFASAQTAPPPASRQVVDFDPQWKFLQQDASGAEQPGFDDSKWTSLSVPHDWSIAGPIAQSNPTGQGGGYFPNGTGWYRKSFSLPDADLHRHVFIVFDGVMANSDVWINGFHLGKRPYGAVSFFYELTGHLLFGASAHNVLAVRADNSQQPASRWYEGAGIYRPVRLVVTQDVHLEPWSVFLTTPTATAARAVVHVQANVENESTKTYSASLTITLFDPAGQVAATQTIAPHVVANGKAAHFETDIALANPSLWDIDHPALYRASVQVKTGTTVTDEDQEQFGIREFHFDPDTGFWLNGRNFKIKGAALHVDGGAVGIAVPDAVYEHRLRELRKLGVNAIRTAHNPPSPQFLDLCDRLGFLVMDEMFDAWTVGKNPYDYHLSFKDWSLRDTADTVRRDRNHPSIILWSAGNEIHDTPHPEVAIPILKALVQVFHQQDPTRPVTQALFRPNASHDYDDGLADLLDVIGQNYREKELLAAHTAKPTRKIIGTENGHDRAIWLDMRDNPPFSGQFLWTGVDYLGEAGEAGGWPLIVNGAGLLDRTGFPRARGFERESWWAAQPNVHALRRVAPTEALNLDPGYKAAPARFKQVLYADWNPSSTAPHTENVEVYTNCQQAELFLNGTSLGKQSLHPDASPLNWKVAYAPGTLKVVGYNDGKTVTTDELRTANKPSKIVLKPATQTVSSAFNDLVFVEATVTDDQGNVIPDSADLLHFAVSGPGTIVAVDNGNNSDHDPFQATERHVFEGRAIVLVRATSDQGKIQLTVTAPNLAASTTSVAAVPATPPSFTRSF